jgi:hypothetical protein
MASRAEELRRKYDSTPSQAEQWEKEFRRRRDRNRVGLLTLLRAKEKHDLKLTKRAIRWGSQFMSFAAVGQLPLKKQD